LDASGVILWLAFGEIAQKTPTKEAPLSSAKLSGNAGTVLGRYPAAARVAGCIARAMAVRIVSNWESMTACRKSPGARWVSRLPQVTAIVCSLDRGEDGWFISDAQ